MAKKSKNIRKFGGKEYMYSGTAHTTKRGAQKRAKTFRNSKRYSHPSNARVIKGKSKGKTVWKIYIRPKGLKRKKL